MSESADAVVGEKIITVISENGLLCEEDIQMLKQELASGQVTADKWRAIAGKTIVENKDEEDAAEDTKPAS